MFFGSQAGAAPGAALHGNTCHGSALWDAPAFAHPWVLGPDWSWALQGWFQGILCFLEASLYSVAWAEFAKWASLKTEDFWYQQRESSTEHLLVIVYFIIPV